MSSYFVGFALAWVAVLLVERHSHISAFAVLTVLALPVIEVLFTAFAIGGVANAINIERFQVPVGRPLARAGGGVAQRGGGAHKITVVVINDRRYHAP